MNEKDPNAKVLMPDDKWHQLFTPDGLQCFARERGKTDDPNPVLEVWYLDTRNDCKESVALILIAGSAAFNDHRIRRALFEEIGREWAKDRWCVYAVRFASAAWARTGTHDEAEDSVNRPVSSYPDKYEIQVVAGLTIDGRCALAMQKVHRDKEDRVRAVGAWTTFHSGEDDKNGEHMQAFAYHLSAAYAAYVHAGLRFQQPPETRVN